MYICMTKDSHMYIFVTITNGGTHGVMVIIIGNGLCYPSLNPERGCLHFT